MTRSPLNTSESAPGGATFASSPLLGLGLGLARPTDSLGGLGSGGGGGGGAGRWAAVSGPGVDLTAARVDAPSSFGGLGDVRQQFLALRRYTFIPTPASKKPAHPTLT